jgi:hypothetical protein
MTMTNAELKEALLNKRPVVLLTNDGAILHCRYVYGITYREKNGKVIVSGEVLDKNGKCIYNCDPKNIRYEV